MDQTVLQEEEDSTIKEAAVEEEEADLTIMLAAEDLEVLGVHQRYRGVFSYP